ncbi:conserved repeat domain [Listeria grayi]|uniref:Lipase-GDSL family acetylesterase n=1 Tax=Listeria grayi FSL F6-1183 TaxID=1265827 RepID=A0A829R9Y8_LISGR|nr:GDSL-type esterase/lipase family protein [Listeria grayi]EUJ29936.1 lipase-GDSL family acetylesterase [Listeria grayi FSL F6-1183]VEI34143.1 conserved repeat domain [Listeria grayi]
MKKNLGICIFILVVSLICLSVMQKQAFATSGKVNVSIGYTIDRQTAKVGDVLRYQSEAKNNGSQKAIETIFYATLPNNLEKPRNVVIVGNTGIQYPIKEGKANANFAGGYYTWNEQSHLLTVYAKEIAAHAKKGITYQTKIIRGNDGQQLRSSVKLAEATNGKAAQAVADLKVIGQPALAVGISSDKSEAEAGELLTFISEGRNNGNKNAAETVFQIKLPNGLEKPTNVDILGNTGIRYPIQEGKANANFAGGYYTWSNQSRMLTVYAKEIAIAAKKSIRFQTTIAANCSDIVRTNASLAGLNTATVKGTEAVVKIRKSKENYFPTVNVITKKDKAVLLNNTITYLTKEQQVGFTSVKWEPIDAALFSKIGKHRVTGMTETGEKVNAIITVFPETKTIHVAAAGDSITRGLGITALGDTYPSQLNYRLGAGYRVDNYGYSGATLLEKGDLPYIKTIDYQNSLAAQPDVVVIQLGTNDTRSQNYIYKESFLQDYVKLLQSYQSLSSKPVLYIALPPTLFLESANRPSQKRLETILPLMIKATQRANMDVSIIDNQTATRAIGPFVRDGIHPDAKGAAVIANNVYAGLKGETDVAFDALTLEAYQQTFGAQNQSTETGLQVVGLTNKSWLSFKNVSISQTVKKQITIKAAAPFTNTTVAVHLGNVDGPLIGKAVLQRTSKENSFTSNNIQVNTKQGVHDLYLVFENPGSMPNQEIVRLSSLTTK